MAICGSPGSEGGREQALFKSHCPAGGGGSPGRGERGRAVRTACGSPGPAAGRGRGPGRPGSRGRGEGEEGRPASPPSGRSPTRVPPQGQLPIGLLELLLAGVAPHPQRLVVTLHGRAGHGAGAGAGARGGADARARAEAAAAAALLVLSSGGSPAPAARHPASPAAAAAAARDGGGARRWTTRAAARGRAEGAAPAAPHGRGLGWVPGEPRVAEAEPGRAREGGGATPGSIVRGTEGCLSGPSWPPGRRAGEAWQGKSSGKRLPGIRAVSGRRRLNR